MRYRYFNPDDGETIEDAVPVTTERFVNGDWIECDDFDDVEQAAETAAEQYQTYAVWYTESRLFAIVDEKNTVTNVNVSLEYVPTFTARVTK